MQLAKALLVAGSITLSCLGDVHAWSASSSRGRIPQAARNAVVHARVVERNDHAFGGTAILEQVELTFDPAPGLAPPASAAHSLRLLVYVPAAARHPSPLVLGINPNEQESVRNEAPVQPDGPGSEASERAGQNAVSGEPREMHRPVSLLISRGYAVATFFQGDLEPAAADQPERSVRRLYSTAADLQKPGAWRRTEALAWALSRCLDYLRLDPLVDATHIAVTGEGRPGDPARLAAAEDKRFAALLTVMSFSEKQTLQLQERGARSGSPRKGAASNKSYPRGTGPQHVRVSSWERFLDVLDARWGAPASWAAVPPTGRPVAPLPVHGAGGAQIEAWRGSLLKALFIPSPLPPPATESYGSEEVTSGVTIERISFATVYGLRVPAILYRPTHRPVERMPALVALNGHGGDKTSWYAYYTGILYARAGAVVLTYDPVGEDERNDEHHNYKGQHDALVSSPESMPVRLGGMMVTDAMQAVSTLVARPDVDPGRIGVLGYSMGSFIGSLLGAADPRVHALLLVGGGDLDGPDGYWDSGKAVMCQAAPYKALLPVLGDRAAVLFTLSARRGDTFIYNGTADTVVAIPTHGQGFFNDLRERVLALNGSERGVFTAAFDPGAYHRPSWIMPVAAAWLDRELHFPAWQGKDVQGLPTIRIRDWASDAHVDLGKNNTDDRAAGIVALAADVPRLSEAQLTALPRSEWERRKSEFTYAGWLERASAAAGP